MAYDVPLAKCLPPFWLLPGLVSGRTVTWRQDLTTAAFGRLAGVRTADPPFVAEVEVPPRERFIVTASSFSLDAVLDDAEIL
jgi:hypothetical protein